MKIFSLFLFTGLSLLLTSCKKNSSISQSSDVMPNSSESQQQIITASNSFGLRLLQTLSSENPNDNVIISPISASVALGMVLNGAANGTKTEIQSVLGFPNWPDLTIDQTFFNLSRHLDSLNGSVIITSANSIWIKNTFTPLPTFLNVNQEYFEAEVQSVDFLSPSAVSTINTWVSQKTNNKIPDMISQPIDSSTVMILLNALYFNGPWAVKFDSSLTQDDFFNSYSGSSEKCKMMLKKDTITCYAANQYQAVDLPYNNENVHMTFILPEVGVDINSFISSFSENDWQQIRNSYWTAKLYFYLPRFTLNQSSHLSDALKALGMPTAFDKDKADFSRINAINGDQRLYISKVEQKTFIEVNESGTEASSTTEVPLYARDHPGPNEIKINRPFLFVIHDISSGTILFFGKVTSITE